ncbi:hypothetical protein GCM10018966_008950 [Streptomyces yanii]
MESAITPVADEHRSTEGGGGADEMQGAADPTPDRGGDGAGADPGRAACRGPFDVSRSRAVVAEYGTPLPSRVTE